MTINIAIVMGSTNTSLFLAGCGVVLREPTLVAMTEDKKDRAVGTMALAMTGRTPGKTVLVAPVQNGIIIEPKVAAILLKEFILRLYPRSYIIKPKIKAVMAVPTGIKKVDLETYYNVAYAAGINQVRMVPKVMMAAVGLDLPVAAPVSSMVVQLGGGTTEIAVTALSGILQSGAWGVTIGGDMMDRAVCDYVAGKFDVKIGLVTAARLKEDIASLHKSEASEKTVSGVDLNTKKPAQVKVSAADLREVLTPYYLRVADVVETAINGCNPEVSSDILQNGIYLSGGASKIPNLAQFLSQRLGLRVNSFLEPEFASIIGGGKLLKDANLLESIIG